MKKLGQTDFSQRKREKLLDYNIYSENFDETVDLLALYKEGFNQPPEVLQTLTPQDFMLSTSQGAWIPLDHIRNCYSAGHDVSELRSFFPTVLDNWETYVKYSEAYNESLQAGAEGAAHASLYDDNYALVNQLVCFTILLGFTNNLRRLLPIIDYKNPREGMIENLLIQYIEGRGTPPDDCVRHLPYFKTLKIFKGAPEQRSDLMREYLSDWYHARRREPYYDSHKRHRVFTGYWSWEAAAITIALNIDDISYRNAEFYPHDLVDFARQAEIDYAPSGLPPAEKNELRVKAGDFSPKSGQWQSLDIPHQVNTFAEGEIIPNLGSHYGLTIWKYLG